MRKFDCPDYSECLGVAALANKKTFTCAECTKQITIKEDIMPRDTVKTGPEVFDRVIGKLKEQGRTATDLIKVAGIPNSNLYNIKGRPLMERSTMQKIASGLGVDMEWLINGESGKGLNEVKLLDNQPTTNIEPEKIPESGKEVDKETYPSLRAVKTIEMYEVKENKKEATIVLDRGVFVHCKVDGLQDQWALDDWAFLGVVAEEIKRMTA